MQTRLTSIGTLIGLLILGLAAAAQASQCMYPFATEFRSDGLLAASCELLAASCEMSTQQSLEK
ncbi:hypothetical protein C2W62_29595 [Candidatus Entotheonella serta]|nr:hypothetical protein C2W62_29595 [Candidatus Entotheonella serta]